MSAGEMRIEYVPLSEIRKWPGNPKRHSLDGIGASVGKFGFNEPPVLDERTGRLVAGHGRIETLEALKAAGKAPPDRVVRKDDDWLVPVVRGVSFGTEAEAEAYVIASNRLVEMGGWDDAALAQMLENVQLAGDVSLTGFSEKETAELLQRVADVAKLGELQDDAIPEPPAMAVTRLGDCWELGPHRLLCGDSTEAAAVAAQGSIDLWVSDPPYGVSYADKNRFLNAIAPGNRIQEPIAGDHQTVDEMGEFWLRAMSASFVAARPGACYYMTGPQGGDLSMMMMMMMQKAGWLLKHVLVWVKNNHVLGRCDYNYKHEPILYGWKDGAGHTFNGSASETSVWEVDKPHQSKLHPTMKPIELFARAIKNGSDIGELVFDGFAGSGTTLIAAQQLERRCYAIELEPRYCDVIIERWQNLTGQKAKRK